MIMKPLTNLVLLVFVTFPLNAQTEIDLKEILEGQRVELLIEMPASSEGVDIQADHAQKMDFEDYSRRIKKFGIALYPGEMVMITKIKKKGKHIEFHLAGGGYGTWGDESENVSSIQIPKSSRQTELEEILNDDKNKNIENRRKLERELHDLKQDRRIRQEESNRAAALESEIKKSRIQDQRLQGGSRFNIRYDYKISTEELKLQSIKNALSGFINFDQSSVHVDSNETNNHSLLSKGMAMEKVISIFGMPKNMKTTEECNLEKTVCNFETKNQDIEAIFIENILVKFNTSSN